ncbi:hypothetical protein AYO38_06245 [bacterium SCGC AG-212-C10]|nr:hypothetical protein AYO38_06195 [bacterium SCGC AG-212-C10]OAI40214.1 hypothetical protein AYO38_06245 [bacterium SCGC AG-212-C10]
MNLSVATRIENNESPSLQRFEIPGQIVAMPAWKRTMDIFGASVGLLMLSPLLVLVSAAVMLDSRGAPFFRQRRIGRGGMPFLCWKFRSMHQGAERLQAQLNAYNEANGCIFKMRDDPRRTRVGKVLRRTSLDELPQLINVLLGQMSLVGPRPPVIPEVVQYQPDELRRLAMVPGMTGLWQVSRRGAFEFSEMVALDVEYGERLTFRRDIQILLRTIPTVMFGRGSY